MTSSPPRGAGGLQEIWGPGGAGGSEGAGGLGGAGGSRGKFERRASLREWYTCRMAWVADSARGLGVKMRRVVHHY